MCSKTQSQCFSQLIYFGSQKICTFLQYKRNTSKNQWSEGEGEEWAAHLFPFWLQVCSRAYFCCDPAILRKLSHRQRCQYPALTDKILSRKSLTHDNDYIEPMVIFTTLQCKGLGEIFCPAKFLGCTVLTEALSDGSVSLDVAVP